MSAHCSCDGDERDEHTYENSPSHFEGETHVTECVNCGGLVGGPF